MSSHVLAVNPPVTLYAPPMEQRKRRVNGTGSLYQRQNGTWAGIADFGHIEGRRCRKVVYGRTKAEASRKLAQLIKYGRLGRWDDANDRRAAAMVAATALGTHTLDQWISKRDAVGCCIYCGATDRPLIKDHATPVTRGGSDGIENVVPACSPCNTKKGNQTAAEYIRRSLA